MIRSGRCCPAPRRARRGGTKGGEGTRRALAEPCGVAEGAVESEDSLERGGFLDETRDLVAVRARLRVAASGAAGQYRAGGGSAEGLTVPAGETRNEGGGESATAAGGRKQGGHVIKIL